MTLKSLIVVVFVVLVLLFTMNILLPHTGWVVKAAEPVLYDEDAYEWDEYVVFEVYYQDPDGDNASVVYLILEAEGDDEWVEIYNWEEGDPSTGLLYEYYMDNTLVDAYTEFYFYAEDINGDFTQLDDGGFYFVLGDYIGYPSPSSSIPVLSNEDAFVEDDNVVFEVTYQDSDGDEDLVTLAIDGTTVQVNLMTTQDSDSVSGNRYTVSLAKSSLSVDTEFFFMADNAVDAIVYLFHGSENFRLGDYVSPTELEGGDKEGGSSSDLGAWGEPEVIVGLVALVGMAGVGGYGIYRTKKKRGRFSELLTQVDNVYRSFKIHPHQCEIELEKIRAVISEELKHNVIDENNYSILKERIDELMTEIRSESLLTEVRDLPKDIEIRIKDMLIDGKITRAEYDKLLPIIKGSDMASDDKEKMEKTLESWVNKDDKKGP